MRYLQSLEKLHDFDFACRVDRRFEDRFIRALPDAFRTCAASFLRASRQYEVSVILLTAIAAVESGWGRRCPYPNDLFGLRREGFPSPEQSIGYGAAVLRFDYLTPGGRCYRGPEPEDMGVCFAPDNPLWAGAVRQVMSLLQNRIRQSLAEELIESGRGVRPEIRPTVPGWIN